jgi:flagellar biosynthetic protein FliR
MGIEAQALASILASLRIVPTLAFAQPFTSVRTPGIVRALLSLAIGVWLAAANPPQADLTAGPGVLAAAAATELLIGISIALALQAAFAALLTVGRALDIQAGFGLAALVDPTTKAQLPLAGTVFLYAAGALFFAGDGPANLLALLSVSMTAMPIGSPVSLSPAALAALLSTCFTIACGIGGAIMLALFLTDLAISFMSRTLPQMNVMLLGFQVKAIVLLLLMPVSLSLSASVILRLLNAAFEFAPELVGRP